MKTSGLAKWGEGVPSKFRLFLDALKRFNEDHCFLLSSGIAFALLLCLIPLLLLVLALIGTYLFSDQEEGFPPRVSRKSRIRVNTGRQAPSGKGLRSPISSRSDYFLRI